MIINTLNHPHQLLVRNLRFLITRNLKNGSGLSNMEISISHLCCCFLLLMGIGFALGWYGLFCIIGCVDSFDWFGSLKYT